MKIKDVIFFIAAMAHASPPADDAALLALQLHFSPLDAAADLGTHDYSALEQFFTQRFLQFVSGPYDYWQSSCPSNQRCIAFAKAISKSVDASWLQILIPPLVNRLDPSNFLHSKLVPDLHHILLLQEKDAWFWQSQSNVCKGGNALPTVSFQSTESDSLTQIQSRAPRLSELRRIALNCAADSKYLKAPANHPLWHSIVTQYQRLPPCDMQLPDSITRALRQLLNASKSDDSATNAVFEAFAHLDQSIAESTLTAQQLYAVTIDTESERSLFVTLVCQTLFDPAQKSRAIEGLERWLAQPFSTLSKKADDAVYAPVRIRFSTLLILYDLCCELLNRDLNQPLPKHWNREMKGIILRVQTAIAALEATERQHLQQQSLRFDDRSLLFKSWLENVQHHPQSIDSAIPGLVQLLMDYYPLLKFNADVERHYNLKDKRHFSLNLDTRAENRSGSQACAYRLKQCLLALLYGNFGFGPYESNAEKIQIVGQHFYLPKQLHPLYQCIAQAIIGNNFENTKLLFTNLERTSHDLPGYSMWLSTYYIFFNSDHNKITAWLRQFRCGAFFNAKRNPWYSSTAILYGLFSAEQAVFNSDSSKKMALLDNCCHIACQDAFDTPPHEIELRLNLALRDYLAPLSERHQTAIHFRLSQTEAETTARSTADWIALFLRWRLRQCVPLPSLQKDFIALKKKPRLDTVIDRVVAHHNYGPKQRLILLQEQLEKARLSNTTMAEYLLKLGHRLSGDDIQIARIQGSPHRKSIRSSL